MQGLYVRTTEGGWVRPKSKKQVREILAEAGPEAVKAEATSFFGNEYHGRLTGAPVGTKIEFVGPDPHTDRRFYGRLVITDKGVKVA